MFSEHSLGPLIVLGYKPPDLLINLDRHMLAEVAAGRNLAPEEDLFILLAERERP